MADLNELDKRVSVLEVEFTNMKSALESVGIALDKNSEVTMEVKARLDKQNGLIPHMSEDIKILMKKQEETLSSMNQHAIKEATNTLKVKIVWGILTAIGAGTLGFILKSVLG